MSLENLGDKLIKDAAEEIQALAMKIDTFLSGHDPKIRFQTALAAMLSLALYKMEESYKLTLPAKNAEEAISCIERCPFKLLVQEMIDDAIESYIERKKNSN